MTQLRISTGEINDLILKYSLVCYQTPIVHVQEHAVIRKIMAAQKSADDILAVIINCTNFAAIKHKNQRRKDPEKTPYINHPIGEKRFEQ